MLARLIIRCHKRRSQIISGKNSDWVSSFYDPEFSLRESAREERTVALGRVGCGQASGTVSLFTSEEQEIASLHLSCSVEIAP